MGTDNSGYKVLPAMNSCPCCSLDSGGNHEPSCPNNPVNFRQATWQPEPEPVYLRVVTDRERELERENEMLKARIGKLKEQLWWYENHASFS